MSGKRAKQVVKAVDSDLEVWAKLGGAALDAPESELDGLSEGEKIMRAGNEWVRAQLTPSDRRTARGWPMVTPFRRE